ncbi:hypothetical protein Tco_0954788 [Tanacetum coccineum]|uniref:Uncharacterized protein n=1 Tax=Tanacetum coccineum TaxID=301880 RepID=A0ABQ5E5G2_9ASTR
MVTEMEMEMGVEANLMPEVELALLCPKMVPDKEEKVESLMDQKVRVFAARQAENKRMWENNLRDNHVQQPPYKRQNVARAYTAGPSERKDYVGTLPLSSATVTNQRALGANQRTTATFYECGEEGHYKSNFLKLKNQNCGNRAGSSEAR